MDNPMLRPVSQLGKAIAVILVNGARLIALMLAYPTMWLASKLAVLGQGIQSAVNSLEDRIDSVFSDLHGDDSVNVIGMVISILILLGLLTGCIAAVYYVLVRPPF